MDRDALVDFEADHYDDLVEEFLIRFADEWGGFVLEQFNASVAAADDYEYDRVRDDAVVEDDV